MTDDVNHDSSLFDALHFFLLEHDTHVTDRYTLRVNLRLAPIKVELPTGRLPLLRSRLLLSILRH